MPATALDKLTLVLGGVASGKSAFAEKLVFGTGAPRRYIATAQGFDDEMRAKIAAHQAQRGPDWTTVEAPLDIAPALSTAKLGEVVLLDCATVWLGNLLHHNRATAPAFDTFIQALADCPAQVIVVSNEVGLGGIPATAPARQFANLQGQLNQRLAAAADRVFFVTAGLPQALKP